MTAWLTIIGIGEDGWEGLSAAARHSIAEARHIIGSTRTLAMLPKGKGTHHLWPQPFSEVVERIKAVRGETTVLLATGDPMNFGVAHKILGFIPKAEVHIIPHLSAFTLAAAHMGWSLPDCDCLTIHGRPASNLEAFIQPDARLLVLTQDGTSVSEACRRLLARGFEESTVTVLENMGGSRQRVTSFAAKAIPMLEWSPLNMLAIQCKPSASAKVWPRVAGLPDDAFEHDGQITKREIRAVTLAALAPCPDHILWDVGAGTGSVAVEWCRSARGTVAHAIEPDPQRQDMIARNADRLGATRLFIEKGAAPQAYAGLPKPHAIFIGGGISVPDLFERAWEALLPGGRMVANAVTLEGDMRLYDLQERHGGEIMRIETSTLTRVGPFRALKPRMPVTQWRLSKPW